MQRNIVIAAVAVFAVLSSSVPVFARDGSETGQEPATNKMGQTLESTVTKSEDRVKQVVETTTTQVEDKMINQQDRIEARKAELKEKMELKAAERKEKLEGRRLAVCQNRQDDINTLIGKSAEIGKAKLARIQAFESGISTFYTDKGLTSETYATVLATVDEKEALAIAALEAMESQEFDCLAIDGASPTDTIKSVHETKRTALKEYRDSVQELLKVVRKAFTETEEAQDEA